MSATKILPATDARFTDVEHALSGGGDGRSCQCQWWMLTNAQWQQTSQPDREALLEAELHGPRSPGLIAVVGGGAAAWVRVGPRTDQPRLARTKAYAAVSTEPWDDPDVWAVSCFVVRRDHRDSGLTAQLLDAAIDYARSHDARVIEGYPVDTEATALKAATAVKANNLFHGALSTFLAAGFHEVGRTKPERLVVALTLR